MPPIRDPERRQNFIDCEGDCVLARVKNGAFDRNTDKRSSECDAAFPGFAIGKPAGEAPDAYKFVLEIEGRPKHEVYVVCSAEKLPTRPQKPVTRGPRPEIHLLHTSI